MDILNSINSKNGDMLTFNGTLYPNMFIFDRSCDLFTP